jgi:hypothetical protein
VSADSTTGAVELLEFEMSEGWRKIEPERRGRVVDDADLTLPESREERGGARQLEPVHGTLPRPEAEHREILRDALVASRRRMSLKTLLQTMPDAGSDADFARPRTKGRRVRF